MKKIISLAIAVILCVKAFAGIGDTTHVITHNQVLHQYFPSQTNYLYKAWGVFPNKDWRKAILFVTFKHPANLTCGQWDYLNYVHLRRKGGVNGPSLNLEMARIITPYAEYFPTGWQYTWFVDVTDFAPLMKDSLEVEYNFTGYDGTSSGSSGYLFTVDFMLIEGTPAMQQTSYSQLWNGSWAYGKASDSLEHHLVNTSITVDSTASVGRFRLLQTGHGAENNLQCSEFCNRYRLLKWDGATVDSQQVWRLCGFNGIPAQDGTWIYDRSNWCPGSMVFPYIYDFKTLPNSTHNIDIKMQSFVANGSANYVFGSQFFQYKSPTNKNDASIENLIAPSIQPEYNRLNPVCDNITLTVKNNGSDTISTLNFQFGIINNPQQNYTWNGNLLPQQTTQIVLPNLILPDSASQKFKVSITTVNNLADDYPYDNAYTSALEVPALFAQKMIFLVTTNNNPQETSYGVKDISGNILLQRFGANLAANTTYRDTITFQSGCYTFTLLDSGGDGLSWWNNPGQGTGAAEIVDLFGNVYQNFNPDFGSQTGISFTSGNPQYPVVNSGVNDVNANMLINVFPNPTQGIFTVDISAGKTTNATILITDLLGNNIFNQKIENMSGITKSIDLSSHSAGIYIVNIITPEKTFTKKIVKMN